MSPGVGFLAFFLLTLAFLGAVVATGLRAKRKLHLAFVGLAVAALGVTIYYAYGLGRIYDLERAGWITPVHMALARGNTAALLVPVATGIATWRDPRWRPMHRRMAFLVLALTVVTAVTGCWMLWLAPPIAA